MKKVYFDSRINSPETLETGFNTVWKTNTETLEKLHTAVRRILSGNLQLDSLRSKGDLKNMNSTDRNAIEEVLNSLSFKVFEFRYFQSHNRDLDLGDLISFFCTQYYYEK